MWTEDLVSVLRSPFSNPINSFAFVGILVASWYAFWTTLFVWNHFKIFVLVRAFPSVFALELKTLGSWAVVTGATDGIGKEYAIQLARDHRLNIVLLSRTMDKLRRVADEIQSYAPGIETKCVAVDFSDDYDIYDKIEAELEGLDIAVLVNNVGDMGGTENMRYFYSVKRNLKYRNIIRINCAAITFMSQIVLPRMIAKKKGVIVNIASTAGRVPGFPYVSLYGASKAYDIHFSQSLELECYRTGVIIQTITPMEIATRMVPKEPSLLVCDVESFVRSSIAAIGIQSRTYGCLTHNIVGRFMQFTHWTPNAISAPVLKSFSKGIREARVVTDEAVNGHAKSS